RLADWQAAVGKSLEELSGPTPELITVKPLYSAADLQGLEHLHYMPGLPPFLRGPYLSMYPGRPWTVRQYAGFSTACATCSDGCPPIRRNAWTHCCPTAGPLSVLLRRCPDPHGFRPTTSADFPRPAPPPAHVVEPGLHGTLTHILAKTLLR